MKKVSFDCLVVARFTDVPLPESMDDKSTSEIFDWLQDQLYRSSSDRYQYLVESKDNKYVSFEMDNYYSAEEPILDDAICVENEDGTTEETHFDRC